jgi:D-alanine transaminase
LTIAWINDQWLPLSEARISPMDRGFLFGDGIYEVIPSYGGKMVGFDWHMQRLQNGLDAIAIPNPLAIKTWYQQLTRLIQDNGAGNLGVYLQVTRGVVEKRQHKFPDVVTPTIFAYTFEIPETSDGNIATAKTFTVSTASDRRWQRCHIKSTALLGNVLHMMEGVDAGADEVLLFNDNDELTEAAACNVFIVKGGEVFTPLLDTQKLPGITRNLLLDMFKVDGNWRVTEGVVTKAAVLAADEVWLTSSTKEVAPVISIDGQPVADGRPGPIWSRAQQLFNQHRFDY